MCKMRVLTVSTMEWCVAAIKTGRYTHAKKAKDITEVKMLLAQQQQQQQACTSSAVSYQDCVDSVSSSDISAELSPVSADVVECDGAVSSSSSSPLASSDLEKIIAHITSVYLTQTPLTPEFIAALPDREKRYLVTIYRYSLLN